MAEGASAGTLKVGVVGTGALGRHHVRILSGLPGADLVGCHDARTEVGEAVAGEHGARHFAHFEELAHGVEAMVVAVPTVDHASVACPLLERGVHTLVEKPLAPSLAAADSLLEAAAKGGARLGVGHVEFYNPAVQTLLAQGIAPGFVEVQRLATFTPRSLDVDVVLDLMIHDLQILHSLDSSPVAEIRAAGVAVLSPRIDIANARLAFESGCVANLTASRVSSERVRKLRVFGRSSYFSLDYQDQEIKGYRLSEGDGGDPLDPAARIRPVEAPVEKAEPLRQELTAFLAACRGEDVRWVDGAAGRQALETALGLVGEIGRKG